MSTTLTEQQFSKGLEGVIAGTTTICTINQENESLLYRGYPAIELAEGATFEEVIHLLLEGRLPKKRELKRVNKILVQERKLPKRLLKALKQIPAESCPMDVLRTGVSFLGALEEPKPQYTIEETKQVAYSLISKLPFLLMSWYYMSRGKDIPKIDKKLSHAGRFLQLVSGSEPDQADERVMNASLILYAEHELNASTFAARITTSTLSDIYSAVTSAIGTLKGPLHGGATEKAIELIQKFPNPEAAEKGIMEMLEKKEKIMGFGHRVYKNGDSRSYIMKRSAKELADKKGKQNIYQVAERIEKIVKEKKGIFPNVDFYTALTYNILNIPTELFTPIFVLGRIVGWNAHIIEQLTDNRLIRPRAIYQGPPQRDYLSNR